MMKRTAIALGALFAAVLLGTAEAKAEKTLSVGMYSDFNGFNLFKTKAMTPGTLIVATSMMEGLYAYDYKTQKIVPRLAIDFKEADDRKSVVIKLRPNVTFHDGTAFNAEAVVSHYSRLMDPASGMGYDRAVFVALDHVEAVDDLSVRFVLKRPWPGLQSALALDYETNLIGSPKALKDDPDGFNRHPVGTGPFVFSEWQSGDRLVIVKNTRYWDSSVPGVDRVVYRILPDGNTRYSSLIAGGIDIMWTDNPAQVADANRTPGLDVLKYEGASAYGFVFNTSKPPFNDPRVRSAVVHSFDGKALVEGFLQGQGSVAHDYFPNSPWSCDSLNWKSYNPAKAEELVKSIVQPVKVTLTGFATPSGRRLVGIAQQFMTTANIQVDIRMIEPSVAGGKVATGDFEMMQWRFTDGGGEPDIRFRLGNFTATRYSNPKVTELLDKASNITDPSQRKAIYCDVSQIMSDDAPMLLPVHVPDFLIARDVVLDLPPNQNNMIRVRGAELQ